MYEKKIDILNIRKRENEKELVHRFKEVEKMLNYLDDNKEEKKVYDDVGFNRIYRDLNKKFLSNRG